MDVVILAGGRGTRLQEETVSRPKPLVEIGEEPVLWHILQHYLHFGLTDFVLALGYKGRMIKQYFAEYGSYHRDMEVQLHGAGGRTLAHAETAAGCLVKLCDTGAETLTGGRITKLRPHLTGPFMLTYGDAVADVDLQVLLEHHRQQVADCGVLATITVVRPLPRFGTMELDGCHITKFFEKSVEHVPWSNGGYMVMEPGVFEYIDGDESLESGMLVRLARERKLAAFHHHGFWQCMDTLRERDFLRELWDAGAAPWKLWS